METTILKPSIIRGEKSGPKPNGFNSRGYYTPYYMDLNEDL